MMRRAMDLARDGYSPPNPHVGCVIVQGECVVGQGSSEPAGGRHAEIVALDAAGSRAREATAYVTLEPCDHTGRTGPCSLALVAGGVSRVIYAVADPSPQASGGAERLQGAGVIVESGLLADEAEAVHEAFLSSARLGRPYVILKAAMTLDGRIALPRGESQWITGPEARREGQRLRREAGAVLFGRRTVEADDPQGTIRDGSGGDPPLRIVLDPYARLSTEHRVFDGSAPTIRLVGPGRVDRAYDRVCAPTPESALAAIWREGARSVLVEGGGETLGRFIQSGLWDRFEAFIAPKLFGDGPGPIGSKVAQGLAGVAPMRIAEVKPRGADIQLTLRPG